MNQQDKPYAGQVLYVLDADKNPVPVGQEGVPVKKSRVAAPNPGKITPQVIMDVGGSWSATTHNWYLPHCLDKYQTYWGGHEHNSRGLYKWPSYDGTPAKVLDSPNTVDACRKVIITDKNIAIWMADNKVYTSAPGPALPWTLAFTFPAGYSHQSYGSDKYGDKILLASYGEKSPTAAPRFVYMSTDGGVTFRKIYEGPNMDGYHIHTVKYDWVADRVVITEGDGPVRRQSVYIDDYMAAEPTPQFVFPMKTDPATGFQVMADPNTSLQPTAICAVSADGIVFGKDQVQDGLAFWRRPKGVIQPKMVPEDFDHEFLRLTDVDTTALNHLFVRGSSLSEADVSPLYLAGVSVPAGRPGYGRILASEDALNWFEIWKHTGLGDNGVQWIVGPAANDPERKFMAVVNIGGVNGVGGENKLLKGRVPKFYSERPDTAPAPVLNNGNRGYKVDKFDVALPYTIAAGTTWTRILTLTNLAARGIRKISVGYKQAGVISHKLYSNQLAGLTSVSNDNGSATAVQQTSFTFDVKLDTVELVFQNNDAGNAVTLTDLEVVLWTS